MSEAVLEPRAWTGRFRLSIAFIIFLTQLALIFWLGTVTPIQPRKPARAPGLRLLTSGSELLALQDASLFALPHQKGFSGSAWLQMPRPDYQPVDWSEPERWLALAPADLGTPLRLFVETNALVPAMMLASWAPSPGVPPGSGVDLPRTVSGARVQGSSLRLAGSLGDLPAWPHNDLLTNTVVQVMVDPLGRPVSFTLLSGSGSKAADQFALDRARSARFVPEPGAEGPQAAPPIATLRFGRIIFEWQTLPDTNTSPKSP